MGAVAPGGEPRRARADPLALPAADAGTPTCMRTTAFSARGPSTGTASISTKANGARSTAMVRSRPLPHVEQLPRQRRLQPARGEGARPARAGRARHGRGRRDEPVDAAHDARRLRDRARPGPSAAGIVGVVARNRRRRRGAGSSRRHRDDRARVRGRSRRARPGFEDAHRPAHGRGDGCRGAARGAIGAGRRPRGPGDLCRGSPRARPRARAAH